MGGMRGEWLVVHVLCFYLADEGGMEMGWSKMGGILHDIEYFNHPVRK